MHVCIKHIYREKDYFCITMLSQSAQLFGLRVRVISKKDYRQFISYFPSPEKLTNQVFNTLKTPKAAGMNEASDAYKVLAVSYVKPNRKSPFLSLRRGALTYDLVSCQEYFFFRSSPKANSILAFWCGLFCVLFRRRDFCWSVKIC